MVSARSILNRPTFARAFKDRRIARRYRGDLPVSIQALGRDEPASMVDVSLTGFRLRCRPDAVLPAGATIVVLGLGFEVRARQVWRHKDLSGWTFAFNTHQTTKIQSLIRAQSLASVMRISALINGKPPG